MTALAILAALKYWLPMVSAFVMVYKAYTSMKTGVTEWADRLLNNHLSHIQASTESTATAMTALAGSSVRLLEEIRNDGRTAAVTVAQVQIDLKEHQREDNDIQSKIVAALEVLKDRL